MEHVRVITDIAECNEYLRAGILLFSRNDGSLWLRGVGYPARKWASLSPHDTAVSSRDFVHYTFGILVEE